MAPGFRSWGGMSNKLMYRDLTMFQWFEGYASIVEREADPNIVRLMLSHFRSLMRDAQGHGFYVVKIVHGVVLDSIEQGEFFWTDDLKLAECRQSAITNQVTSSKPQSHSYKSGRGNKVNFSSGGSRGNGPRVNAKGKPTVRSCDFYNRGVCSHRNDHQNGNIYWRHVCSVCSSQDHVERECSFLMSVTQG
jgi:hypothetical protein